MKKVILILAALVLVASGVAAVSAYEAHVINVKAHVENALTVNTTDVDFGTVFPEEWISVHRNVRLSDSAVEELGDDLVGVNFTFYAEWKECIGEEAWWWDAQNGVWVGATANYCDWLGDFLYVGWNVDGQAPSMTLVGPAQDGPPSAQRILTSGRLTQGGINQLHIAIDVPVFEGFYNDLTDMPIHPNYDPEGMDFGVDLKIQVTGIDRS
jgi:hypothetical protein